MCIHVFLISFPLNTGSFTNKIRTLADAHLILNLKSAHKFHYKYCPYLVLELLNLAILMKLS